MIIKRILEQASQDLAIKHFNTPILDAELILAHVINQSKEYLYTHPENKINNNQIKKFDSLIKRRLKNEPVAYLTKEKWFFGNKFYVNKSVLIPRPETELICEQAIYLSKSNKIDSILDIGTGSGNIIVSLAKNLPKNIQLCATDINQGILKIAQKNAKNLDCVQKIKFIKSNLFENINRKFDIILANLPYVPNNLNLETGEPAIALYGGIMGTEIYEKFFSQAQNYLNKHGHIIIEIDSPAISDMKKIIRSNLDRPQIKILKDLTNRERTIQVKL